MKDSSVYITDYIDNPTIESAILGRALTKDAREHVEVLLVWHEHVDAEYVSRFPNLKAAVRYGVGYDNLDLDYLSSQGIYACNTPDYGVDEVSDTALAMIMNAARGVTRYDHLCREFVETWQENTISSLKRSSELTVGVIGAGRIGGSVLIKLSGIGFKTIFYDPFRPSGHEKMLGSARAESLDQLLEISDIVSLHVPLDDTTRGFVDSAFLSRMKSGASLVNTARGGLISSLDAFYDPLRSGHLCSVGLDVIPEEPAPQSGKLIEAWRRREDWLDGRLVINPHAAYYSDSAYKEMREKAAINALRILSGQVPLNIVNGL